MNFYQAKRELESYGRLLKQEEDTLEDLYRLQDKCTKVTTVFSDMPKGSYDNHKLEQAMAELADETDRYLEILDKVSKTKKRIEENINRLDGVYQRVLHKRYIQLKPIYQVRKELNYSERWTKKLINRAIYEYSQIGHQKTLEDTP